MFHLIAASLEDSLLAMTVVLEDSLLAMTVVVEDSLLAMTKREAHRVVGIGEFRAPEFGEFGAGVRVNLSIPQHRELSVGTLRALIGHTGLTVDKFPDLL